MTNPDIIAEKKIKEQLLANFFDGESWEDAECVVAAGCSGSTRSILIPCSSISEPSKRTFFRMARRSRCSRTK